MICRSEADRWLLIPQLAHSWVAGQMAVSWGNENFALPSPGEAVVMATTLHDIGWIEWDTAPRLKPDGRLVNFLETSLDETRQIWRRGIFHVGLLDPYAALLVSMHASTIYRRRLERKADPLARQEALQSLLDEATATQADMIARLKGHPLYAQAVEPTRLKANYRILRVCDLLSLLLYTKPLVEGDIIDVPGADYRQRVTLHCTPLDERTLAIEPFPFSLPQLTVSVNARSLAQPVYPNLSAFHTALSQAPVTRLVFSLVPMRPELYRVS
jgi:hypothetical protein